MISEFEAQGYWHWAILIYLLSKDLYSSEVLTSQIKEIVSRNIKELVTYYEAHNEISSTEALLLNSFQLPESILNRAKGIYYMEKAEWGKALNYLKDSEEWEFIHKVLMEKIVPCILNKNDISVSAMTLVKKILMELSKNSKYISNWQIKGMTFKKFLEIVDKSKEKPRTHSKDSKLLEEIQALLNLLEQNPERTDTVIKMIVNLKEIVAEIQRRYLGSDFGCSTRIKSQLSSGKSIDRQMLAYELASIIYNPGGNNEEVKDEITDEEDEIRRIARQTINFMDKDDNETLELPEWKKFITVYWKMFGFKKMPKDKQIIKVFEKIDTDNSKTITVDELVVFIKEMRNKAKKKFASKA